MFLVIATKDHFLKIFGNLISINVTLNLIIFNFWYFHNVYYI